MSQSSPYRILIIDDNPAIHADFRKILTPDNSLALQVDKLAAAVFGPTPAKSAQPNFEIDSVSQGNDGLECVVRANSAGRPYALAFVDVRMPPGWDGIETIKRLWQEDPNLQVVICTAFSDYSAEDILKKLGCTDRLLLLKKPFDNLEVLQFASALTEKWNLARQVQAHVSNLKALVKERTLELEHSLSMIKATLDATADGILVVDTTGRAVNFNEILLRMWNIPLSRMEGCSEEQFLAPILRQLKNPEQFLRKIRESLHQVEVENLGELEFKDGRFFEHYSHPQHMGGAVVGRVWSFRDITQRRRAEEKVRLLAHTMESIQEMATITDLDNRIIFANKACLDRYGYRLEELIGQHFNIFHSANNLPELQTIVPQQTKLGGWRGEIINRTKDDREFLISLSTSNIKDDEGNIIGLVGIAEEITERKRAEEALRSSENHYRLLFENNPTPIYVYDQQTLGILAANEPAARHYGYSNLEMLSLTLNDIALPEEIPAFLAKLNHLTGTGNSGIWRHRKKDGKLCEMEISSHALTFAGRPAWLSLAMDVTERLNLEAQLRQSQKMESVGQLAGGIAHDFNNLLTVINGHTGLLLAKEKLPPQIVEPLKEISEAARRAAELTRQLLTFSRKQVLQPQVVDLNEVVNNVSKMLRRILGEDISLEVTFSPSLPAVKADLGMIEQVLLNLAVNSRDAMPKGGKLTISTSSLMIDEAAAKQNPEASPGRFIRLTFADSGCGISAENLPRIFEPFFTTKELDRGTGLGLATVYGIIKQHQGWIHVASRVGEGTSFEIYLPASREKSGSVPTSTVEQRVIGGTETILVVEDEVPLLKLMHHILESHGYKVLECSTGKAALEIWGEHRKKIDLLLTDMVLPDGLTGTELAETLQASKPALKVVYTSGYDIGKFQPGFELREGLNFIQKPFHARKLAETVHDCLNA